MATCLHCKALKRGCDGVRPVCGRCRRMPLPLQNCVWLDQGGVVNTAAARGGGRGGGDHSGGAARGAGGRVQSGGGIPVSASIGGGVPVVSSAPPPAAPATTTTSRSLSTTTTTFPEFIPPSQQPPHPIFGYAGRPNPSSAAGAPRPPLPSHRQHPTSMTGSWPGPSRYTPSGDTPTQVASNMQNQSQQPLPAASSSSPPRRTGTNPPPPHTQQSVSDVGSLPRVRPNPLPTQTADNSPPAHTHLSQQRRPNVSVSPRIAVRVPPNLHSPSTSVLASTVGSSPAAITTHSFASPTRNPNSNEHRPEPSSVRPLHGWTTDPARRPQPQRLPPLIRGGHIFEATREGSMEPPPAPIAPQQSRQQRVKASSIPDVSSLPPRTEATMTTPAQFPQPQHLNLEASSASRASQFRVPTHPQVTSPTQPHHPEQRVSNASSSPTSTTTLSLIAPTLLRRTPVGLTLQPDPDDEDEVEVEEPSNTPEDNFRISTPRATINPPIAPPNPPNMPRAQPPPGAAPVRTRRKAAPRGVPIRKGRVFSFNPYPPGKMPSALKRISEANGLHGARRANDGEGRREIEVVADPEGATDRFLEPPATQLASRPAADTPPTITLTDTEGSQASRQPDPEDVLVLSPDSILPSQEPPPPTPPTLSPSDINWTYSQQSRFLHNSQHNLSNAETDARFDETSRDLEAYLDHPENIRDQGVREQFAGVRLNWERQPMRLEGGGWNPLLGPDTWGVQWEGKKGDEERGRGEGEGGGGGE